MKRTFTLLIVFGICSGIWSQNEEQRALIIAETNVEELNRIVEDYEENQNRYSHKSIESLILDENGDKQFFSHFDNSGKPIYYSLENESSAISSKIDKISSGGDSGLDLDGTNVKFGLWDNGSPRTTHQEFSNNINPVDPSFQGSHASHVAGILVAEGINPSARGMAPGATIDAHTVENWPTEIPLWAAQGGLISNHSYTLENPQEDYEKFGVYNIHSKNWDAISYSAPYFVMCTGASNNGSEDYNPDNSRYDLLSSNKVGKNSIVVGACHDVLNYIGPFSVSQTDFTSWGPTDDWRIKPDITAVGSSSFSTREESDSDYGSGSGCSYASPVVAGGIGLLQQHYYNLNAQYMKASTVKGLILCTADEAGIFEGPDFSNGWGLFNAENAANLISSNGFTSKILELTLDQNEVYSTNIEVKETEELTVAICWNDPPNEPLSNGNHNDPTLMLINDLDLRVKSDSTEYLPWRIEPNSQFNNYSVSAERGDNYRDNIEIINVKNIEEGDYTIQVSHKGILESGAQDFSLIINGIDTGLSSNDLTILDEEIEVYPNPTNSILNISIANDHYSHLKMSMYNISGQKQLDADFEYQEIMKLNIEELSKGTYFLKIYNENYNLILTKKVVIY